MPKDNKSHLKRTRLGKNEAKVAQKTYNNKGQLVDPNNHSIVLKKGQIQKGHKYGYEDRAMRRCAERCKMSQADYDKMCRQFSYKTLQLEDAKSNMSHQYECTDKRVQNHNCMKVIREYKNQNNGKNLQPAIERHGKTFSAEKSPADRAKSDSSFGYRVTHDANGRATMTFGKQLKAKVQNSRTEGKSAHSEKNSSNMKSISGVRSSIGKAAGASKSSASLKGSSSGSAGSKGGSIGNVGGKGSSTGGSGGGKGK